MLRSIADHAAPGRRYNLFFLHSGITGAELALLDSVIEAQPHMKLMAIPAGEGFAASYRSKTRKPSNATYNRFLLFLLMPKVNRLLYLDCDTILMADPAGLFDTNIAGAEVAGVPDWIMSRTLNARITTLDPAVPDLRDYQLRKLGLSDAMVLRYFNAGVMIFNFAAIEDVRKTGKTLIEMALSGRYLFRDQDILNAFFKDRLALLPADWNVFNSASVAYDLVPAKGHAEAMAARADPKLIHYADFAYKPWLGTSVPWGQHYWHALIRTPFYAEVVTGLAKRQRPGVKVIFWRVVTKVGRNVARWLPFLRLPLRRIDAALGRPGFRR